MIPALQSLRSRTTTALWASIVCLPAVSVAQHPDARSLASRITALGATSGGIVGMSATHVETGRHLSVRGSEKFPMASVYKLPIALYVLHLVDRASLRIDSLITVTPPEFAPHYSPLAESAGGNAVTLTVDSLLALMLGGSDNTASDVLLRIAGGPAAVTQRLRALGISDVRVDRTERELGFDQRGIECPPANDRWSRSLFDSLAARVPPDAQRAAWVRYETDSLDTATPDGMARLLVVIARGEGLRPSSRRRLLDIMTRSWTGANRIKGLLPRGSPVAHKTGTAGRVANDVGIITLPDRRGHVALAVFLKGAERPDSVRDRAIAGIARVVYDHFASDNDSMR
ncbi:MAG: class A beta-lactamase [Gemmatimonadaceae bacterium]